MRGRPFLGQSRVRNVTFEELLQLSDLEVGELEPPGFCGAAGNLESPTDLGHHLPEARACRLRGRARPAVACRRARTSGRREEERQRDCPMGLHEGLSYACWHDSSKFLHWVR